MKKLFIALGLFYAAMAFPQDVFNLNVNSTYTDANLSVDLNAIKEIDLIPGFNCSPSLTGGKYFNANIYDWAVPPADDENILPTDDITKTGRVVGATSGQYSVTPNGTASYSIPINVSPGTAGMQPKLSIVYSNMGSDGVLGTGFSIAGLSMISRVPCTLIQDNIVSGVDFDDYDKYALDGNRLMLKNPTDIYGHSDVEYYTEMATWQKVISKNYSSTYRGPTYFTVQTKSGLTEEYGNTPDSKIIAPAKNVVAYWLIHKISDIAGNYMTYTYECDTDGDYRIAEIDYTGNSAASLSTYCSVVFDYIDRNNTTPYYINGSKIVQKKLLKTISCKYGSDVVRQYDFNYRYNQLANKVLLVSVTESGANGTKFNPTQFFYDDNKDYSQFSSLNSNSFTLDIAPNISARPQMVFGDWNKDGKTDFVACMNGSLNYRLYFSNSDGSYTDKGMTDEGMQLVSLQGGDFNGDGYTDLFFVDGGPNATRTLRIYKYDPTLQNFDFTNYITVGQVPYVNGGDQYFAADFNGDGLCDILVRRDLAPPVTAYYLDVYLNKGDGTFDMKETFVPSSRGDNYFGDVNGDGLLDLIVRDGGTMRIFLFDGNYFTQVTPTYTLPCDGDIKVADINGDGRPDILFASVNGIQVIHPVVPASKIYIPLTNKWVYTCTNATYETKNLITDFSSYPQGAYGWTADAIETGDFNGDGRTDIMVYETGTRGSSYYTLLKIYINTAYGHYLEYTVNNAYTHGYTFMPVDLNGDGATDILKINPNDMATLSALYMPFSEMFSSMVNKVSDGLGNVIQINYSTISDRTVYPAVDVPSNNDFNYLQSGLPVVKSVKTTNSNPNDLSSETDYYYHWAMMHKKGRGFLGFESITKTDVETGIKSEDLFTFDIPTYFTALLSSFVIGNDGYTISSSDNNLRCVSTPYGYTWRTISNDIYKYELGSTVYYDHVFTENSFDDFGNVLTISQTYSNGDVVLTTNTYTNDATNWILGRLTQATVTKTSGGVSYTKKSSFTYNTNGVLNSETIEPDRSAYTSSKAYTYDAFGNVKTITYSATGISNRVETKNYDTWGRFVLQSINAKNQTITKTYDFETGNVLSEKDANNVTVSYTYDDIGRLFTTTSPTGITTQTTYNWVPTGTGTNGAIYYTSTTTQGLQNEAKEYFNSLGKSVKKSVKGFDGTSIVTATDYDSEGRPWHQYKACFDGTTALHTDYKYDILDRPDTVIMTDGGIITTTYSGFTSSVTNQLGQTETRTMDAQGRLSSVQDNANKVLNYGYDILGESDLTSVTKTVITDSKGNQTIMFYDINGNRTKIVDPDIGTVTYTYDAIGRLVSQTDNKGATVSFTYDELDRTKTRTENEGTTAWTYDTETNGIGKLANVALTGTNNHSQSFKYDTYGRVYQTTETIDKAYTTSFTFDSYGRVITTTYPTNGVDPFVVKNIFNSYGYLSQVVNNANPSLAYFTANTMNAAGQMAQFTLGNGLVTTRNYYDATDLVKEITTSGNKQDLYFEYDALGNLTKRQDKTRTNLYETFAYDGLNRLISQQLYNNTPVTVQYDEIGNITSKSDVGTYGYDASKPHELSTINGSSSVILHLQQNVTYTSFDKVSTIIQNDQTGTQNEMDFQYGFDHNRITVKTYANSTLTKTNIYVGGLYEKETAGSLTKEMHYITAGGSVIAVYTRNSDGTSSTNYLHKDHLGSIQCITDETGNVKVAEYNYDAWGVARDPATWLPLPGTTTHMFNRGYTGHEQLDLFSLVNMSGRIYDPILGRFLSADIVIQDINNMQCYNHYSYCLNNPLSMTDPTGYTWLDNNWKSIVTTMAAIAVSFVLTPASATFIQAVLGGAAGGFTGGFTGALLNGASFTDALACGIKGGIIGGITAGLMNEVGTLGKNLIDKGCNKFAVYALKAELHGDIAGLSNVVQGGKFGNGFMTGALSEFADEGIMSAASGISNSTEQRIVCVVAAAAAGGTIAEIGGGNFGNGAITGAYQMLFNHLPDEKPEKDESAVADKTKVARAPSQPVYMYNRESNTLEMISTVNDLVDVVYENNVTPVVDYVLCIVKTIKDPSDLPLNVFEALNGEIILSLKAAALYYNSKDCQEQMLYDFRIDMTLREQEGLDCSNDRRIIDKLMRDR